MTVLRYLSVAVLVLLIVVRTGPAIRSSVARTSWAAAVVALAAFMGQGIIVSYSVVDSWIGGANWLHLIRNSLVVTAIWLLRASAIQLTRSEQRPAAGLMRARRYHPVVLAGVLVAICIPFLLIERPSSSETFLPDTIGQSAAWWYSVIYMLAVAWIGADMAVVLRHRFKSFFALFILGGWAITLASASEIFYLTTAHFDVLHDLQRPAESVFGPLFYLGIALVVLGLAVRPIGNQTRAFRAYIAVRRMGQIAKARNLSTPRQHSPFSGLEVQLNVLYETTIVLRDWEANPSNSFTSTESGTLASADRLLQYRAKQIVVPRSVSPTTPRAAMDSQDHD